MDAELAAWLRQEREKRGWPKAEMARRLVQAGREAGDKSMPSASGMLHNIHRWEREGGVSERHKLHYCRALGIQPGRDRTQRLRARPWRSPRPCRPCRHTARLPPLLSVRPPPTCQHRPSSLTLEVKSPFRGVWLSSERC
jgi:hypothetical protein